MASAFVPLSYIPPLIIFSFPPFLFIHAPFFSPHPFCLFLPPPILFLYLFFIIFPLVYKFCLLPLSLYPFPLFSPSPSCLLLAPPPPTYCPCFLNCVHCLYLCTPFLYSCSPPPPPPPPYTWAGHLCDGWWEDLGSRRLGLLWHGHTCRQASPLHSHRRCASLTVSACYDWRRNRSAGR